MTVISWSLFSRITFLTQWNFEVLLILLQPVSRENMREGVAGLIELTPLIITLKYGNNSLVTNVCRNR